MRQDNPILEIARGIDTVAIGAWRFVVKWSKRGWGRFHRWLRSPWFYAMVAALQFATATFVSSAPIFGFGLGVLWLYIGFRQAVRGPEPVELKHSDPQTLGLFRIRALTVLLVVALLANHSDYDVFSKVGFFLAAALLMWDLDRSIKR